MLWLRKTTLLPLALSASLTFAAGAQQKQECTVDEGNPSQIARATLALQMASSSTKPADAEKQLANAVKMLNEKDAEKNPLGRDLVLGKVLVLWLNQPDVPQIAKRGTIGYTDNPDGTIDLLAAIDTAFTAVETGAPGCAAQTAAWRAQKGWVNLVNQAVQEVNADKVDSAEMLAKRSLLLNRNAPYAYMVLGNVAQKRGQTADALRYYQQTVDVAAKDTSYAEVRRQVLLSMGNVAAQAAQNANGSDKASFVQQGKLAYQTLLKDPGKLGDQARQGLGDLACASGDTTAFRDMYKDMLANPSNFEYLSLMNAGVSAARCDQVKDAITLFEGAYAKNGWHRDVLYNLASMYTRDGQYSKAIPLLQRLMTVDPSNGDNYRLFAFAYAGMQKGIATKQKGLAAAANDWQKKTAPPATAPRTAAARAAATKAAAEARDSTKFYTDSANFYFEKAKGITDSALKYNGMADSLPVKVSFTQFTPGSDKATIGGSVTNNGDAAKAFTIHLSFLNKDGQTVSTQDATVGPINPKSAGRFEATGTGAGIVAFKYDPVK